MPVLTLAINGAVHPYQLSPDGKLLALQLSPSFRWKGSQFLGENIPVFKKLIPPNVRGSQLFEFSIPIYLKNRLHKETLDSYRERFLAGECPTALAMSVLDIKGPGDWEGNPKITEHWCLAHYLLDGHHKMYAAASVHKPLTVLSFMDMSKGIATEKAVDYLFARMS